MAKEETKKTMQERFEEFLNDYDSEKAARKVPKPEEEKKEDNKEEKPAGGGPLDWLFGK